MATLAKHRRRCHRRCHRRGHRRGRRLRELDDVLGIRLRVVVRDKDRWVVHIVHRGIVQLVRRRVKHVGGERVLLALAELANSHTASKHVLHAVGIGPRIEMV